MAVAPEGELAMAAVGMHGSSAAGAFGREHDEVPPAIGRAEADIFVGEEGPVLVAGGLVLDAFLGDHVHLAALDAILGQVLAGQGADAALIGYGTDEGVEEYVATVGAFRRGRQP